MGYVEHVVKFKGLDEAIEDMRGFVSAQNAIVNKVFYQTAGNIQFKAVVRAPVRTGWMQSTIYSLATGYGRIEGGVEAPYSGYVHEGTGPHIIVPRYARMLRFVVGGRVVYTRMVRHPGTKAQPFLFPAVDEEAETIIPQIEQEVNQWLRGRGWE